MPRHPKPARQTDAQLLRRVAAGDEDAFGAFCARYEPVLLARIDAMLRDPHAARDVVQETLLRVWQNAARRDPEAPVRAWVLKIATNLALNRLRTVKRRREQPYEQQVVSDDGEESTLMASWMIDASSLGPDALAEQAERNAYLRRLVEELPESKRDVVRLVYDHEMELHEVSEQLDIPLGTVKSRIHHAIRRLSQRWNRDTEE